MKPDVFARKVPTHPSAQQSEPYIQSTPHPRETHHRLPQNLTSEPQIHATHSFTFLRSIQQLFYNGLSCPVALACSKAHPLSPKAAFTSSFQTLFGLPPLPSHNYFCHHFTVHTLYVTKLPPHTLLHPPSAFDFLIPDPITNC